MRKTSHANTKYYGTEELLTRLNLGTTHQNSLKYQIYFAVNHFTYSMYKFNHQSIFFNYL